MRRGEPPARASVRVLGVRLAIDCDADDLIRPFLRVFSRCVEDGRGDGAGPAAREVRLTFSDADGVMRGPDGSVALARGPLRAAHVYNLLYTTLVSSIDRAYLLHAAAVARRRGGAVLVAGPAGSGKTTLARLLAKRGFGLLSDDIAPLSVEDGRVHPFPRRIGLAEGERDGAAVPIQDAARVAGKTFASPESLGLEVVGEPRAPAALVLMDPYQDDEDTIRMELGLLGEVGAVLERFERIAGARIATSRPVPGLTLLRLEFPRGPACLEVERAVAAAQRHVMFHERDRGPEKRFDSAPRLERVSVRDAAVELLKELLNRNPDGALARRLGGRLSAGLFELSALLRGVDCYRLTPASPEANADLVAARLGGARGGGEDAARR